MRELVSIRWITCKYLSVILAVSLLGLLALALLGWQANSEDTRRHRQFEVKVLQRQFSEQIEFYRGIATQLSRQLELIDILQFRDRTRALGWAKEVRKLLPESIGVALSDAEGYILGEPLQLNLGPQCVSDLAQFIAEGEVGNPPIHAVSTRNEHFDIIQRVVDDGEVIGVLFISFSLRAIQQRAEKLLGQGQYLRIENAAGVLVSQSGDRRYWRQQASAEDWVGIDNTDWRILYVNDSSSGWTLLLTTLLVSGVILSTAIAVMIILSLRLFRIFNSELALVKEQLDGVYTGKRRADAAPATVLSETRDIMRDVWALLDDIERANRQLQEQTVEDELSGLLNRRGFRRRMEESWELSYRNVNSSLVLLDLDHFKHVNDNYGHAVGDRLIIAMARTLTASSRKTDTVARLGGDEFVVILSDTYDEEGVVRWYSGVTEGFRQSLRVLETELGERLNCSISAGAVVINKQHYDRLQQQIDAADRALYKAKEAGRSRLYFKQPGMRLRAHVG